MKLAPVGDRLVRPQPPAGQEGKWVQTPRTRKAPKPTEV